MKFKLEYVMEVNDNFLLADINDGLEEEYTNINEVPEPVLIEALYEHGFLEAEIEDNMTLDRINCTVL